MVKGCGQKPFKGRSIFGKKLISFKLSASPSLISLHTYSAAPQLENRVLTKALLKLASVQERGGGGQGRPPEPGALTRVAD